MIKTDYTEDKNSKMTKGLFSSRTEEWETPQYVFDWLNSEFHFTLDVCATPENAKCKIYFTKKEDGLKQDWQANGNFGRWCWMNPPYGKEIDRWMGKAYNESRVGANVVCLVHARTDTRWFHDWALKADEIWFIKGRLKFGDGKQSAPFPSCVVIFRALFNTENIYNIPICQGVKIPRSSRNYSLWSSSEQQSTSAVDVAVQMRTVRITEETGSDIKGEK
jgi:phage N-6-adenine-methyltransferase